jgi:hypothetical protein
MPASIRSDIETDFLGKVCAMFWIEDVFLFSRMKSDKHFSLVFLSAGWRLCSLASLTYMRRCPRAEVG